MDALNILILRARITMQIYFWHSSFTSIQNLKSPVKTQTLNAGTSGLVQGETV